MSRRVLILGASGLLGRAMQRCVPSGVTPLVPDPEDLPLEDPDAIDRAVAREGIDRFALLAAWTAVDDCESDPARAFRLNAELPGRIAALLAFRRVPVLFMSTDYVFDGRSTRPYREDDPAAPLSVYAQSKLEGERRVRDAGPSLHCVVRSAGLYGSGGPDFVGTVRDRLGRGPLDVVTDEVNAPTLVDDLAPALWTVVLEPAPGVWHLTAGGAVSRFDCARRIAELCGVDPERVRPTTRAAFGRPAPRPAYSVLDCGAVERKYGLVLPSWEVGLTRFLAGVVR